MKLWRVAPSECTYIANSPSAFPFCWGSRNGGSGECWLYNWLNEIKRGNRVERRAQPWRGWGEESSLEVRKTRNNWEEYKEWWGQRDRLRNPSLGCFLGRENNDEGLWLGGQGLPSFSVHAYHLERKGYCEPRVSDSVGLDEARESAFLTCFRMLLLLVRISYLE